ncbi:hypothetical protein F5148DRAFT_601230 [Russula earlei]|uniref:Uncharacterized protein n=1 Tax=Russula earlei TaxID=71964 RepID=A0ACC0TXB9_9AGAM|nr:hypothetical protein F5148DRAFT_601230 [Russula earlei]
MPQRYPAGRSHAAVTPSPQEKPPPTTTSRRASPPTSPLRPFTRSRPRLLPPPAVEKTPPPPPQDDKRRPRASRPTHLPPSRPPPSRHRPHPLLRRLRLPRPSPSGAATLFHHCPRPCRHRLFIDSNSTADAWQHHEARHIRHAASTPAPCFATPRPRSTRDDSPSPFCDDTTRPRAPGRRLTQEGWSNFNPPGGVRYVIRLNTESCDLSLPPCNASSSSYSLCPPFLSSSLSLDSFHHASCLLSSHPLDEWILFVPLTPACKSQEAKQLHVRCLLPSVLSVCTYPRIKPTELCVP